jgi:branched-chain amino acid transport system permease protein
MELLLTRLLEGFNNGVIYGFLALALVCTYRGSRALNLAQGEMAMFCTFVAWELVHHGVSVVLAVLVAAGLGAFSGGVVERTLIRPLGRNAEYPVLLVTIGLFLSVNALAGVIWGGDPKAFPTLVPSGPNDYISIFGARDHYQDIAISVILLVVVAALYAVFRFTRLGLAMRAAAGNPDSALLLGVRVNRMNSLGWALAGGVGALLGPLIAPGTLVSTSMFFTFIIYACAAATLGGFDSPIGAVLGGVIIGIVESLVSSYVSFVGDSLKLAVALVILLIVLMVKPSGLLGTREAARV